MAPSALSSLAFIDTHSHLDVARLNAEREELIRQARSVGFIDAILCAGDIATFSQTISVAHTWNLHYALGIHPLALSDASDTTALTAALTDTLTHNATDPALVAIGEVGLEALKPTASLETQYSLLIGELKLARDMHLPLSIHARHAVDLVIKALRQIPTPGGVIHAFNGSTDQAKRLIDLGFKLGFGGAMTYEGSRRIRRLATQIPRESYVFETDTPDMPGSVAALRDHPISTPADIYGYAQIFSELRGESLNIVLDQALRNTYEAFPRLKAL